MSSATTTRAITALCLLPLILGAIFYLPDFYFNVFLGMVLLLAAKEWGVVNQFSNLRVVLFIVCALLVFTLMLIFEIKHSVGFILLGVLVWLFLPYWLYQYEKTTSMKIPNFYVLFILGILVLSSGLYSLVYIRSILNAEWLLALLLIIWIADTAAYFCGRKWGKNKLAPRLSPGKTLEGVIGGIVFCMLFIFACMSWFEIKGANISIFIITALLVVLFSIIGDLFESMVKRLNNKKDSGTILPGHGGILDRIDSLLSSAPFFALGISIMQVIQ